MDPREELWDFFAEVMPLLTDDVMQRLNARVDGDRPGDVALDRMVQKGLVNRG